jgi:hypothetical protein
MATVKPDQYGNREREGDAHEAFVDILSIMVNEESELLRK